MSLRLFLALPGRSNDEQKRIAEEMQRVAMDELPFVPLGAYLSMTALRANLRDRVKGFAIFWGIRRA